MMDSGEELETMSFVLLSSRRPRTDAHFFGAVGGAGGAEVCEIDAGDQEDEHGNDGEDVNDTRYCCWLRVHQTYAGMEVHVR